MMIVIFLRLCLSPPTQALLKYGLDGDPSVGVVAARLPVMQMLRLRLGIGIDEPVEKRASNRD